ncbi:MAG: RrF2 family transcriptional regulator [Planctomycetota bacterium]|jgi:Rrf2 family protein
MKLSTRTRYGVRAMFELAKHYEEGPLHIKVIAEHQDISVKYLENLMGILKSAGLVRTIRGRAGGYILTKSPNKIKLGACYSCLEGSLVTVECVQDRSICSRSSDCPTIDVWDEVHEAVMKVLNSKTLQDLVDKKKIRTLSYQI